MDFLILPSPLLPVDAYRGLVEALTVAGHEASVADASDEFAADPRPQTLVSAWARQAPRRVLLAHSNAGFLAPHVAERVGGAPVIFLDAAQLPAGGLGRLAPEGFRAALGSAADAHGVLPPWTRWFAWEDMTAVIPEASVHTIDAACPRLPLSYFDAQIEAPHGWRNGRNAYVRLSEAYDDELAAARADGWPSVAVDGGHLDWLWEPGRVASAIGEVAGALQA